MFDFVCNSAFWWAGAGIALMLCEFAVPGLVIFFFGIGALVTALLSTFIPMDLTVEVGLFMVASLVSLFGLRRLLRSVFVGHATAESGGSLAEGFVGLEAEVSESIVPGKAGRVNLHGTAWRAESDEELALGRTVVVVGQKSLTLLVKGK